MGLSNGFSQLLHHEAGFFFNVFLDLISSILEKLFAFNTQKECRKSAGLIKTWASAGDNANKEWKSISRNSHLALIRGAIRKQRESGRNVKWNYTKSEEVD